jgi:hypothetical protein
MAGMWMVDTSALMMQALVQSQMKEFRAALVAGPVSETSSAVKPVMAVRVAS